MAVPRQLQKLNARSVASLTKVGRHSDGGSLYLVIDRGGAKRWSFIFRWNGKLKEMGLGGLQAVPLAKARELAAEARATVARGLNPIDERRQSKDVPTFGEVADDLIASLQAGWRNAKHRGQWKATLETHAKALRPLAVDKVTTEDVLNVLKPIWTTKSETASRLRGRIERVLDAAKTLGHRTGENPAAWRGHLRNLLPARQKLTRGHHAALPFDKIGEFVAQLRDREAVTARALEFTILTAARSGEVIGATWQEYDEKDVVWIIPAARMKAGREHRVPLSKRAVEILKQMADLRTDAKPDAFIFPGQRRGRPLSTMAMDMLLRRLGVDVTVHGFRSTFRDWAGERSTFPREVAEAALAHIVGDETERAYRRGDALEKRRRLMDAWASYCAAAPTGKVVAMSAHRR
jgi:integrase